MAISRRSVFKLTGAAAAAAALSGCTKTASPESTSTQSGTKTIAKHQVVIIGGGFGGLTVAKELKKIDPDFDVLVIEKNDSFMSCPFSNTNLGKLKGINLGTLVHDYDQAVEKHGYSMLQTEVTAIDRKAKTVTTTKGAIGYDYLVLSPGIEYNYKAQFPNWDKAKTDHIRRVAPPALIPGREHIILERQLADMEDGNVIITVPKGKFRCPPAPFERASMIAAYMKKEEINGKVIILNETDKIAKGAAFKEAWNELYPDIVEYHPNCKLTDVDTDKKTVSYTTKDEMGDSVAMSMDYEVLNLIAYNKANPVIEMADLETVDDVFGKVVMNGCSFATKTDPSVYAVGDVVGHAIPPSGQTANWAGKHCAAEIGALLHGKTHELSVKTTPQKAGNVCYSMVGDKPEEGVMVVHDFHWTGEVIGGKGHVPKGKDGKFRSKMNAKATREWYRGIMNDLFA